MICAFLNPQFTGIITASGNSKIPFIVNTIGLDYKYSIRSNVDIWILGLLKQWA